MITITFEIPNNQTVDAVDSVINGERPYATAVVTTPDFTFEINEEGIILEEAIEATVENEAAIFNYLEKMKHD